MKRLVAVITFAALVGAVEPVLGPIWVWLIHAEVSGTRTLIGGGIVFAALFVHLLTEWWRSQGRTPEAKA